MNASVGGFGERLRSDAAGVVTGGYDGELGVLVAVEGKRVPESRIASRYEDCLVLQRRPETSGETIIIIILRNGRGFHYDWYSRFVELFSPCNRSPRPNPRQ